MNYSSKVVARLALDSATRDELAEMVMREFGADKLIKELKASGCGNRYTDGLLNKIVCAMINSRYFDEMVILMRLTGTIDHAICHYINHFDNTSKHLLQVDDIEDRLLILLENSTLSTKRIVTPLWHNNFDMIYRCMAKAFGSPIPILREMSPSQIALALPHLKEFGFHDKIDLPRESSIYPGIYFREVKPEDRRPIFKVLAWLHGPVMAQIKMDDAVIPQDSEKYVYLSVDDMASSLKQEPILYIKGKLNRKNSLYDDVIRWTIRAYVNENRIQEVVDNLESRELKNLLKREIICTDDLSKATGLPPSLKRKRMEHDLGM